MNDSLAPLLAVRKSTHGEFFDHARVVRRLKSLIADEAVRCGKVDRDVAVETFGALVVQFVPGAALDAVIAESLDMILHKIGRVIAGDAAFEDHWRDIAGYATLVADRTRAA